MSHHGQCVGDTAPNCVCASDGNAPECERDGEVCSDTPAPECDLCAEGCFVEFVEWLGDGACDAAVSLSHALVIDVGSRKQRPGCQLDTNVHGGGQTKWQGSGTESQGRPSTVLREARWILGRTT